MSYLEHTYTRLWEAAIECMDNPCGMGDIPGWPDSGPWPLDLPLMELPRIKLVPGRLGFAYFPEHADERGVDIELGTPAVVCWFHELCHWADYQANGTKGRYGQNRGVFDVVAEMAGTALMLLYGYADEVDWRSTAMRMHWAGNYGREEGEELSVPKLMDLGYDRAARTLVYLLG